MNIVDTHVHVFVRGLKLAPVRRYVPDYDAAIADYQAVMHAQGISQAVLVQPSFLGTDNSFMCEALRAHRATLRGIAVVDPEVSESDLDRLQADGVVGIRLNLDRVPLPDLHAQPWPTLLASLKRRNWQVEVHLAGPDLPPLVSTLVAADVNVVIDHFGRPDDNLGTNDPSFRALLKLGASGKVWVKLSAAYRNGSNGRGLATAPKAAALLLEQFGAERLLWGSDWPHTRHESSVDVAQTRRQIDDWISSESDRQRILGQNAIGLFQF